MSAEQYNRNSLVSVIIPVYNVEKYLSQCVDSVINQTYKNLEILLINDGSTDDSGKICDEYARKDTRVKVIHKENGGLSSARNKGIREAIGDYLMFLDSDDYLENDNCLLPTSKILLSGQDIDIVFFRFKSLYGKENKIKEDGLFYPESLNCMDSKNTLKYLVSHDLLWGSACAKITRSSFIKQNNLYFKKGIKSEDIEWILRLANCLPKYFFTNGSFYIYRKGRENSITSTVDFEHLDGYRKFLEEHTKLCFKNADVEYSLLSYIAYHYIILCALTFRLKDIRKKMLLKELRSMQYLFEYDLHPKLKKVKKIYHLFGFNLTVFLLGKYLIHRKKIK